ncbi:uncharacterized protein GGS22DRAFT_34375 [Annulohypoxylon maeteangense]|uniref:uncharacterized protein n=1 Tax=Annulohypoxylon maeteangense TaxID=1927788 RepID=UPI0020079C37|nr:uncharacterized protein GGS22DRAFT_34375 [Annulohypoxylon maeteangense]KAI0883020.1 hypothetical protein GGS22DRAFT_34375 [Annulohypoxylon maeteangense]
MAGELVLLTGGTGFLGYAILIDLLKSGYRVRVAARSQAKIDRVRAASSLRALNPPATQLMFVIVPDMTAPGAYDEAVLGVDFIIHVAAPLHTNSTPPKEQLEEHLVASSVQGSLGILKSANEKAKTVRRIVMTSSTVAIAPTDIYAKGINEHDIVRGPEYRIAIPAPPYDSGLHAYCAGKTAALQASEAFVKDNATHFDLISILPSWILGKDKLAMDTRDMRAGSNGMVLGWLLAGGQKFRAVGNAVLCTDVARAHVRALDPDIKGNQSFLLNTEVKWEDTVQIAKKYFPDAFTSGLFQEGAWQLTLPLRWDSSKVQDVLGINLATYDTILKEVVGQYLELAKREGRRGTEEE